VRIDKFVAPKCPTFHIPRPLGARQENRQQTMEEIKYLNNHKQFIHNISAELNRFIYDYSDLALEFSEFKTKEIHPGFNLFLLISDTYYKENFHSDILKSLLDPQENHNEGFKYLKIFLEYLIKKGAKLSIKDFQNSKIYREKGKIDILIKDEVSKRAIIIENKINGFFDMPRQIPRYHKYLTDLKFDVVAVAYLLLSDEKKPNIDDWTQDEIETILKKVISVSVYKETSNDLFNGWILPCERITQNADALFVIRQYGKLLEYLGGNNMNKPIMEKFYESVVVEENFKTAISLKSMIEELPNYRIEKIVDTFIGNPKPFYQLRKMSNTMTRFEGFEIENSKYAIDIVAEIDKYKLQFWDTNYKEGDNPAKYKLQNLGLLDDFYEVDYWYEKLFAFPSEETKIYDYIKMIMNKLK